MRAGHSLHSINSIIFRNVSLLTKLSLSDLPIKLSFYSILLEFRFHRFHQNYNCEAPAFKPGGGGGGTLGIFGGGGARGTLEPYSRPKRSDLYTLS